MIRSRRIRNCIAVSHYLNGERTCQAHFTPRDDGWIVEAIFTMPDYRREGYARELLEFALQKSGRPARVYRNEILPHAERFWVEMWNEGLVAFAKGR